MHKRRRKGKRTGSGKHWLAGSVMAAGLGAAVMTGTATASASTDDSGASAASTSAASDAPATKASRNAEKAATKDEAAEPSSDTGDTDSDGADADTGDLDDAADADDSDISDDEAPDEDIVEDTVVEAIVEDTAVETADEDPSDSSGRHAAKSSTSVTAAPEVEQEPAAESATTAVALRTAAAPASDPVLVAAATSTKVTLGSMIVDMLYSWGIRSTKMGTNWLDIKVSKSTETRWLTRRAEIYRNVVIPEPQNPTEPEQPNEPEQPSGPKLLWETNFSSMAEAMKYWGFQTGRWGQSAGENQYYTDGDNVYIDADGNLVIDARREATPDNLGSPNNYTSARVVTMGKQSFGVGQRIVARIQMPTTKGVLPAFWSVGLEPGHEYDWPRQGEIDIVEIPTLGTPASAQGWSGNIHGPSKANNTVDVKLHNIGADLGVDVSQGFHEYGIDWHADRIIWHVDGVQLGQITKAQYEALGGDWTPFSGAWDHYLILNVAVGNPWNGDPDPSKPFSAQMKVDWVKAYDL